MAKLQLVLAQAPGLPSGDLEDRLELRLGLTPQGQLDGHAFESSPTPWLATRERPGRPARRSELIRLDGGWALQSMCHEDDPLWAFEGWVFRPGELVRLRRPDGTELLFRIVQVEAG
jgi:hypothetical protein